LGGVPTGVAVVTARTDDGKPIGITINSFSSVSLEPPLVLWSLAKGSPNLPHFAIGRRHIIHVLADHQDDLARRFSSRSPDKFSGLPFDISQDDIPLLDDCVATFECATRTWYEEGDHVIVIAHVRQIDQREREPLLFWGRKFLLLEAAASSRG
jgi:flavin reductase (DIM6/NTAB) family NADH-FMN oxidoreductase RutF